MIKDTPLYDNIAKEILADTYLSARIDTVKTKELLLNIYDIDDMHNIDSMDYIPVIFLGFIDEDIADFFLFRSWETIEKHQEYLLEKIKLEDTTRNTFKRLFWTQYAATIVVYLELNFGIIEECKLMLLEVLKQIIQLYSVYEEMSGVLKNIAIAYRDLFRMEINKHVDKHK